MSADQKSRHQASRPLDYFSVCIDLIKPGKFFSFFLSLSRSLSHIYTHSSLQQTHAIALYTNKRFNQHKSTPKAHTHGHSLSLFSQQLSHSLTHSYYHKNCFSLQCTHPVSLRNTTNTFSLHQHTLANNLTLTTNQAHSLSQFLTRILTRTHAQTSKDKHTHTHTHLQGRTHTCYCLLAHSLFISFSQVLSSGVLHLV